MLRQVLSEWGHTWMWESLNLSGDGEDEDSAWLREAIKENTLVAVTDGSYMKELYPDMNSCAFILKGEDVGRLLRANHGSLLLSR